METSKPSNPKDIIGSNKLPLHLWPQTATILGSLALLDGMLKYGRSNWRAVGVNATIYYDACMRHLTAWFEGEDIDPDSGLPHLAHALACIAILADAQAVGKLNDNRFYPGGYHSLVKEMTPHVQRLKEKYADRNPKHYTIQDAPEQDYGDECCDAYCHHAEQAEQEVRAMAEAMGWSDKYFRDMGAPDYGAGYRDGFDAQECDEMKIGGSSNE